MKIELMETCYACPEQYDAFDADTGKRVGYLRLRHGSFTVDCPDVDGLEVYQAHPHGDGRFMDGERDYFLHEAMNAIRLYYNAQPVPNPYILIDECKEIAIYYKAVTDG